MKKTLLSLTAPALFALALLFAQGCPSMDDVQEVQDDAAEALIVASLLDGDIVTVDDADDAGVSDIEIDGVLIAQTRAALTTGCFGLPTCVAMDEPNRGVIRKSTDDFANYDNYATGTTYFLTDFYGPYWATAPAAAYPAMDVLIMAQGYRERRNGWCLQYTSKCAVPEI